MPGANDAKVAFIYGQNAPDIQPLGQSDNGSIYKIELHICILVKKLIDTGHIGSCYGLELKWAMF